MMKILTAAMACVLLASIATPVLALGPVDVEAELPVYSKYVWRGMVNVDDYVLQPAAEVGLLGFELGFWGNLDLTDVNDQSWKFTEIDWTLGYELELPLVGFEAGFIYYTYPQAEGIDTWEFYLGAEANVILHPSIFVYQDIDTVKGAYWDLNVSHGFALGETSQLQLSAGLGLGSKSYMDGYFGMGGAFIPETELGASMTDGRIRAEVPFHPVPLFTVSPSVTWTTLLGDAKDAVDGNDILWYGKKDAFYWGLTAGFEF